MPFYILYLYLAFLLAVNAIHNLSADDNDPSIIYQPPGTWGLSNYNTYDEGGQHKLTSNSSANASFTFTGVAIYFYSPLWTFPVTTQVALDNLPPVLLDLRDYKVPITVDVLETGLSSVVWSQTDLANTQHTLLVSVGKGQPYAILDALVYTVLDAGDVPPSPSPSSSSLPSTSPISALPSSTSAPKTNTASSNSSRKGLPVALGVVCTIFGLFMIGGIWWFIRRWQRRSGRYNFPRGITNTPQMFNNTTIPAASDPSYIRGRNGRFRSMPTEVASVTNNGYGGRRTGPSSAVAAVQDRHGESPLSSSSSPQNRNDGEGEGARAYPQPLQFVSI